MIKQIICIILLVIFITACGSTESGTHIDKCEVPATSTVELKTLDAQLIEITHWRKIARALRKAAVLMKCSQIKLDLVFLEEVSERTGYVTDIIRWYKLRFQVLKDEYAIRCLKKP